MSDSENTTENKTDSNVGEATPNLEENKHHDNQTGSSKSNIFIPIILLLISAIVITATFYEDEYKNLIAQADQETEVTEKTAGAALVTTDAMTINSSTTEAANPEDNTAQEQTASTITEKTAGAALVNTDATVINSSTTEAANTEDNTAQEQTASTITEQPEDTVVTVEADTTDITPDAASTVEPSVTTTIVVAAADTTEPTPSAADATTDSANDNKSMRSDTPIQRQPYENKEAYEKARKEAIARAQEQAKKHKEMMLQRRQEHEKEMRIRRDQFEATKKAYKEKRAEITKAQKEIYQQFEKNRTDAIHKMEEMHKEIAEMQKKMRKMLRDSHQQMMRESKPQFRNKNFTPRHESKAESVQII